MTETDLVCMVEKCSRVMLNGRVKPAEAKKYWQSVLDMIPNADKAWDFCALCLGCAVEGCSPSSYVKRQVCGFVH